jgi:hypothetical protein
VFPAIHEFVLTPERSFGFRISEGPHAAEMTSKLTFTQGITPTQVGHIIYHPEGKYVFSSVENLPGGD